MTIHYMIQRWPTSLTDIYVSRHGFADLHEFGISFAFAENKYIHILKMSRLTVTSIKYGITKHSRWKGAIRSQRHPFILTMTCVYKLRFSPRNILGSYHIFALRFNPPSTAAFTSLIPACRIHLLRSINSIPCSKGCEWKCHWQSCSNN